MKQLFTSVVLILLCTAMKAQADHKQTDSIRIGNMLIVTNSKPVATDQQNSSTKIDTVTTTQEKDTLRIGNMMIVTEGGGKSNAEGKIPVDEPAAVYHKKSTISTNWIIVDLGFSNYIDQTNYNASGNYIYQRPGVAPLGSADFSLNTGKSINVNIWLFMQRMSLVKNHLNLKYGLGVELNNYRYKSAVSYREKNPFAMNQAPAPVVFRDSVSFSKNKLAADYITIPLMLNYSSNANSQKKGLSISLGVSVGYLYSQRNKQVSDLRGKQTTGGDFGIQPFKFSYVGEIGLGPVRLYGSYSPTSFFKQQLDMRPYTLGVRLSNW